MAIINNHEKEEQLNLFVYCESCYRVVVLENMRKIDNRIVDDNGGGIMENCIIDDICGGVMENWVIETTCRACERFSFMDRQEIMDMNAASNIITNEQMNEVVNLVISVPGRTCIPSFASIHRIKTWFGNDTRIINLYVEKNERCVTGVKVLKTPATNFFL